MTPLELGIQGVKTSVYPQSEETRGGREACKKGEGKSASQRDGAEREEQPWKGSLGNKERRTEKKNVGHMEPFMYKLESNKYCKEAERGPDSVLCSNGLEFISQHWELNQEGPCTH